MSAMPMPVDAWVREQRLSGKLVVQSMARGHGEANFYGSEEEDTMSPDGRGLVTFDAAIAGGEDDIARISKARSVQPSSKAKSLGRGSPHETLTL